MPTMSDELVIRYVLGEASPPECDAIHRAEADDRELAATLELLSECRDLSSDVVSMTRNRSAFLPGWRRVLAALAVCLGIAGLSMAGWAFLHEKPLLADDFDSGWGDPFKWSTPKRGVFLENGHLRLFDRGYLVSADQFSGPIEITFRWRWTDLTGDFLYRDELTVALRTSGVPRDEWSHEATDGVFVKLNVTTGSVRIMTADNLRVRLAETPDSAVPYRADHWYHVRITDDGESVAVYVWDPQQGDAGARRPLVSANVPGPFLRHHIAFYNRERLASASHESWIDDVAVRALMHQVQR